MMPGLFNVVSCVFQPVKRENLRPLSVITDVKSDLRGAGGREIKGAH